MMRCFVAVFYAAFVAGSLWLSGCVTYKSRAEVAAERRASEEPPPPPARSCRARR